MEITRQQSGDATELRIAGRLDAYWSDHLSTEIKTAIRDGSHHLILDLSRVEYISSAGIRVLLMFYQQLTEIHGSLSVSKLSEPARSILEMAGLAQVLVQETRATNVVEVKNRQVESQHANFEVFVLQKEALLRCRIIGDPDLLERCGFKNQDAEKIRIARSSVAFGLGAFGSSWEECKDRFGEFLAVAGNACYLPTDGTNVPDYLVSSGSYLPELLVLYGAICSGEFSHLLRFEVKKEVGAVSLVEIMQMASEVLGSSRLGSVLIGEAAGLVGASLLKSPVVAVANQNLFQYPETTNWLSFTAERAHSRSLAVVVGMAASQDDFGSLLRPLGKTNMRGHFHAAAFPYRPIKRGGELNLQTTVSTLFEAGGLEGLLHLLEDDREIGGAGQSEFIRGAVWISRVEPEEAPPA